MPGEIAARYLQAPDGESKVIVVAIDTHAETSHPVLHFAMRHVVKKDDTLHLISVLPLSGEMEPTSNVLDAPAPLWSGEAWKKEREAGELAAIEALKSANDICRTYQPALKPETFILEPQGAASGAGASITRHAAKHNAGVVLVGTRGLGAFKRGLLAVAGMGSVSQYCLQHLHCPTICVKHEQGYISPRTGPMSPTGMADARPQVCLAVDNTEHSHKMLVWASQHLIRQDDFIHLISVAHGAYPSGSDLTLQATAMDPAPVLACTDKTKGYLLIREAHRAIQKAVEILESQKIPAERITTKVLEPEGGASEVALSIVHYINRNNFHCAVVGNRCESGFIKYMSNVLLHNGSVSNECLHKVECPIAVYKFR